MQKKSKVVQHFPIKPSQVLSYFYWLLNASALLLVAFSSLAFYFKFLLVLLLALIFLRQLQSEKTAQPIIAIEVRDNHFYVKTIDGYQLIENIAHTQNRWFAELTIKLKQQKFHLLLFQDSFQSKSDYCRLMHCIRWYKA
ncbi:MAG: hypothetical protein ISR69_02480 [Gammaproteobacteria bacterium]|nr:hypothetical protein [Gammaproteobacteria bacterium]